MSSTTVSLIVFGVVFAGALVGMALRAILPDSQMNQDARDAVKLAMSLVATMSALVLGLLIASAKSSLDAQRTGLAQLAADVIVLDRILVHYGPEGSECRHQLRLMVTNLLDRLWPHNAPTEERLEPPADAEQVYDEIAKLAPKTDAQKAAQAAAIKTGLDMGQARWLLYAQKSKSVPVPFLVVLVFWLALLFASFSIFTRPNTTVVVALLLSALSVAGAVFLILELDHPFHGVIELSSDPLRRALAQIGH
jgi:hypothetical protein